MRIDICCGHAGVACGGPYLHDASAAVKAVADEAVPAAVDRQFALALASEALAAHLESFAKVPAFQRMPKGITVLRANEAVIVRGALLQAKTLPLA